MDEVDFDGSLVLEKLAETGIVQDFFAAIDSDDFDRAKTHLKRANVEPNTIATVLEKILESEDEH